MVRIRRQRPGRDPQHVRHARRADSPPGQDQADRNLTIAVRYTVARAGLAWHRSASGLREGSVIMDASICGSGITQ
ncbi:hypothetical protein MIPYR_40029 [uncultured Microbacterium sp.]|uniref:Uncharacterized protein n=1 Tax=uncultured Microbacterium sp. TaxID=191216 RepID=A0A1Y5P3H0_9MICO|nr:hypothetical protein MIPYR_40029 [uncultured Microbacterium sp.]